MFIKRSFTLICNRQHRLKRAKRGHGIEAFAGHCVPQKLIAALFKSQNVSSVSFGDALRKILLLHFYLMWINFLLK